MNLQYWGTIGVILLFFLGMFLGGWCGAVRKGRRPFLWGLLCLFFPLLFICLELSQSFENGKIKPEITQKLTFFEYIACFEVCFFVGILFMIIFSLCSFR